MTFFIPLAAPLRRPIVSLLARHGTRRFTTEGNCFRRNIATDEWVVFSAARRERPRQFHVDVPSVRVSEMPAHDSSCPFCRGNEHLTPPATLTDYGDEHTAKDWTLRVVPNKYPAVAPTDSLSIDDWHNDARDTYQLAEVRDALGFHEVIIEGGDHNVPTALASVSRVESLVRALRTRGQAMLAAEPALRHIMYFKNSGPKAGASLLHPHSQVVGLPIVPNEVARRQRHAREWYLRFEENVFEHALQATLQERSAGGKHRVVLETDECDALS
mmetsp:Transcript_16733/g.33729  ORF Transcript_16733/g.33729 Transcript_16733/m.33729 type:complete len:272 (-) Transcript_16733:612-1427(-)